LELSADPDRLDLSAWGCKIACETGAMISIGTEAQSADALDRMALGVKQARRGWLERENVLNALPASDVDRFISRHAAISAVLEPKQA
jgi:DNA polymerase (family 10)